MKTTQEQPSAARDAGQPDRMEYYSGNRPMGFKRDPGEWEGGVFTSPDGFRWIMDPVEWEDNERHPSIDGTGVHYLVPESIAKAEGGAL